MFHQIQTNLRNPYLRRAVIFLTAFLLLMILIAAVGLSTANAQDTSDCPTGWVVVAEDEHGGTIYQVRACFPTPILPTVEVLPATVEPTATPVPSVCPENWSNCPPDTTGYPVRTITLSEGFSVRSGPSTDYQIVGRLPAGAVVTAVGRNSSNSWLAIQYGTTNQDYGWIVNPEQRANTRPLTVIEIVEPEAEVPDTGVVFTAGEGGAILRRLPGTIRPNSTTLYAQVGSMAEDATAPVTAYTVFEDEGCARNCADPQTWYRLWWEGSEVWVWAENGETEGELSNIEEIEDPIP